MSRQLAVAWHRQFWLRAVVGAVVIIGLSPVLIKVFDQKSARAEGPGTTCVATSQASKDHLIATYPDIYSNELDPNKTMVKILDPNLVANTTEYDDEVVCLPSLRLRWVLGMGYVDVTVERLKTLENVDTNHETCIDDRNDAFGDDLTGISYAVNLKQFQAWCGMVSDLTPLSNLTSLELLDLRRHAISDLTPLASLANLRRLWLDDNQIKDFSPLANLPNLNLDLWQNTEGVRQINVVEMTGGNSYVSELRGPTGSHPVIDDTHLANATFDPVTNTFTMIDPDVIAVIEYNFIDDGGGYSYNSRSSLYLLPNGLRGKTTEAEVLGSEPVTYQSDAYVISPWALNQIYPKTGNQYGAYFNEILCGSVDLVLRLEEQIDDGVVPTASEVLLDGVSFNETKYAKLYRARTMIEGQKIVALIVHREALPDGDPDKPTPEEWVRLWNELSLLPLEEYNDIVRPFLTRVYHTVSLRTQVRAQDGELNGNVRVSNNLSIAFLRPVALDGTTQLTFEQMLSLSDYQIQQGPTVTIRIKRGGLSTPQVPKTGWGMVGSFWSVVSAGLVSLGGMLYWRSKQVRRHYRVSTQRLI